MTDPLDLNIPLSDVKTERPLLADGDYPFQIVESVVVPNKDANGRNWHLKLALTEPQTSTTGLPVHVNFPLFLDIALQAKEGSEPDGFKRNIAEAVDAIFALEKGDPRPGLTHELVQSAVGKFVKGTVNSNEWPKGSGDFNNKIRRLKKA